MTQNNIEIIKKKSKGVSDKYGDHYRFSIDANMKRWVADSYDEAMILALAYKYEGANSKAAIYFLRMLNIKSDWSK